MIITTTVTYYKPLTSLRPIGPMYGKVAGLEDLVEQGSETLRPDDGGTWRTSRVTCIPSVSYHIPQT